MNTCAFHVLGVFGRCSAFLVSTPFFEHFAFALFERTVYLILPHARPHADSDGSADAGADAQPDAER